jgi:hypothetical protein
MILQELLVPLKLDDSNFSSGLDNVIQKASFFGSFLGNIAASAVGGAFDLLGQGLDKVSDFLSESIGEASAAADVQAQLQAVLKSTGGAAGVTADQVNELANKYSKMTRFEDDAIVSTENLLLTFTNITEDVFPETLGLVLDISTAMGQDLKTSAIQVGKAMNDPITGMSALQRVGVTFTEEQKEMVKQLVESGDMLGAQAILLGELQREFGGSAEAAGKTFGGQLEILKNKLGNIKEQIGTALLPVLTELATRFSTLVDSPAVQAAIDAIVKGLETTGDWIITNLPIWMEKFQTWITGIATWWDESGEPTMKKIQDWLAISIPVSIDASRGSWELLTALWDTYVLPIGKELVRLFDNVARLLGFVDDGTEGNTKKTSIWMSVLSIFLTRFAFYLNALHSAKLVLQGINRFLEDIINKSKAWTDTIYFLTAALARLTIPWWLTPGSPTPLENGLRGIQSAMSDLNKNALPQFAAQLNVGGGGAPSAPSMDYHTLARVLATELSKQYG